MSDAAMPVPAGQAQPAGQPAPGSRLTELAAVMDRLRRQCPWDARQTHQSLAPYLLEETYEALDALAAGDPGKVCEELGDVLLQVFFHARIAAERTDGTGYTIDDVADGIAGKLMRRHPHVFGDTAVAGAGEVIRNWDAIKAAERAAAGGESGSVTDGIPLGQPALALAAQLIRRAARAGAPAELADFGAGESIQSAPGPAPGPPSEIGAELIALAGRAARAGLDPELELRAAAHAYRARVVAWERSGRPQP